MARSDGSVILDTRINTDGFSSGMNSIQRRLHGISGAVIKLGGVIASAFVATQLVQFGKEAIELGSDLQEVQNVVDVTFTTMSESVNEFAKNAAESAGISEIMAKRYAGTFGAMAKAFGFAESESFAMSTALTQLAGDVASFYNITQDEAYTKLKSVFTGETESLKDLGVVMTQSALDSFAMAKGYQKTTQQMSEQEKVALRYSFVMEQLSGAQGDFARTSDSWANQTRILSLNFDTFKANIGQALINIFTPFLKTINQIVSKMAQLSSHFIAFSEMIVGKSTSGGGGSPGDGLKDITDGFDNIADSAADAEKAQKKYLSGLDEIKTFSSSVGETGAIQPDAGIIGSGEVSKENEEIERSNSLLDEIVKKFKKLKNLFSSGFSIGLGDTTKNLNILKSSLDSIKKSFSDIFNTDLSKGFNASFEKIIFSAGQITGAFSSIGLTIGANLLGGFSGFLSSEKGNIQSFLIDIFDIAAKITEKAGEAAGAFAYIFEAFANKDGQKITEDILGIFSTTFTNITELAWQFKLDVMSLIVDPFVSSKEDLKESLEDALKGISDYTSEVRRILNEGFGLVWGIYEEHIQPIFDELVPEMEKLWQEHIAPLFSKVGEFFSDLGENIGYFWDNTLKPFIQWFSDNILPVITPILKNVLSLFISIFGSIADIIGAFLDIINGLNKFITGVFTGDWERAWDGIKEIFQGVFDAFESIVKGPVNAVIDIINSLISAVASGLNFVIEKINSLSFEIPEWVPFVGGESFGLNIPTIPEFRIPYLATGAVIPPNSPFVAMLGDQKHGTNIEAPLDTIKQAVREVIGSNGNGAVYHFVAQIDGKTLFEQFVDQAQLEQMSTGRNPLTDL